MTKIEWTDVTWNPTRGCTRVSEGCRNCYAERIAARNLPGHRSPTTGEPFAILTDSGPRWTGDVELIESKLEEPLHWRKPRRVFVNSMSDLFHESLPDEAIDRLFAVMALCPQHTFQVLTKRAERMRGWLSQKIGAGHRGDVVAEFTRQNFARRWHKSGMQWQWPLPNVWLGVSVEDDSQQQRVREIVKTPAAVRFISYEPALGPLDLRWALPWLQWVICGGESGPGARPLDLAWARIIRDQCRDAGVACFMKQLGARPHYPARPNCQPVDMALLDRKGGDMEEWPEDLRVRQFPDDHEVGA
jgi:protein gp37